MSARFAGKTVLVTGGGSGMGRGMAMAFAAEGANVAVIGRRQEPLAETVLRMGSGFAFTCDVRDAARVEEVVNELVVQTGRLDVLVNNAAGNFVVPSEQLSPNGFKAVVDIVLNGTFHCTRSAFEHLRASRGSILNIIASYAWTGEPGVVHSASAKAGVLAMTRTLAAEWGQYGIRANALAPGPVHTEGTDKNLWSIANVEEHVKRTVPLGRIGTVDDVAKAALWLCSDDASWVSGATLTVDGAHWVSGGTLNFREAFDRVGTGE